MIPGNIRPLFWDVNPADFEPASYPEYTISRVLELGDPDAVAWMRGMFTAEQIGRVIREDRKLSRRSANFWALVYQIRPEEIAALNHLG